MGLITQSEREYYEGEQLFTGNGSLTTFTLVFTPLPTAKSKFRVFYDGLEQDDDGISGYNSSTGVITFSTAPANGVIIKVLLESANTGNYRYISLENIVNNFMVSYIGDGKIIDNARKLDVLFHCKRAIQEFSYDVSRIEKIFEVTIPSNLTLPVPQDYVNYVKLAWADDNGLERPIYPARQTSRPSKSALQDTDANYLYDNDNSLLLAEPEITESFKGIETNPSLGSSSSKDYFAQNPTYSDSIIGYGRRYGSSPENLQVNGVFIHDEANGKFGFSSNLSGKNLLLHYVSDGLGTDAEMKIHKMAEEAVYKYVAHAILSAKANVPEYIVNRFRRERRAAMRNAKLRLSNIKLNELSQIMRNKSKHLKH